jgi:predicted enzyme related to lactoylglutathione lyase
LAIGSAPGFTPSPDGCSVALEVEDFDGAVAHLRQSGVKFRLEPFTSPVCRMASFYDPDGNCLIVHKRHPA